MILPKAILTPSGRPQLGHGEIERLLLDKVCCLAPSDQHSRVALASSTPSVVNCASACLAKSAFIQVDLEFEGVGGTEGCTTADRYQARSQP
jgi:hypothetical protein